MSSLSSESSPTFRPSLKEMGKTRGGLWSIIAGASVLAGVLTIATLDDAQEGLNKITETKECAVNAVIDQNQVVQALNDSTLIRDAITNCIDETDARIAESVQLNMVDSVRDEVYARITSDQG